MSAPYLHQPYLHLRPVSVHARSASGLKLEDQCWQGSKIKGQVLSAASSKANGERSRGKLCACPHRYFSCGVLITGHVHTVPPGCKQE
eukprot:scaffold133821_cov21-Tisochrysis_lutea.AAC.1